MENVSFEDAIGHLYIDDIELQLKKMQRKQNLPITKFIHKQRTIDPCERSVFQLLEQFVRGEHALKAYRSTAKAHANPF